MPVDRCRGGRHVCGVEAGKLKTSSPISFRTAPVICMAGLGPQGQVIRLSSHLLTIPHDSFIFSDTTYVVLPKSCVRRGVGSACARYRSGKLGK